MPIQKVTSGIIADGAIVATDIADGTVTGPKLGANSVSSNNIIASVTLTTPIVSGNLNLDTAGTTGIRVPAANTITFHTAGTEDMRIDANGNIGIGTSTITSGAGWSPRLVLGGTDTALIFKGSSEQENSFGASGGFYIDSLGHSSALNNIIFRNTNVNSSYSALERMRITSGGFVGIGSANPGSLLEVNAGSGFSSSGVIARFFGTSGNSLLIRGSGNCENTNGAFGAISDAKLKENIVDATPKLDKVNQLKVRNYNLIGDELKQIGFVAQEIEQVFPGIVSDIPDVDAEGNDLGTTTKTVKTTVLIPILVKAIQEQQAMIEELKTKVTALENANK
jgi:hypothetical protein